MAARLSPSSPLLLGSTSPRRRDILASLDVPFVLLGADADAKLAAVRARLHGSAAASLFARPAGSATPPAPCAILVADTTVVLDGAVLGKPRTAEEGEAMLRRLAGRTHEVRTRFLLAACGLDGALLHGETVTTVVTFRPLTAAEVAWYVSSGEGSDKAGGYAIQGRAAAFASRIDGSYSNVVGLPACEVSVALRALGLR